jgi:ATP-dependent DNA helicase 2 subunit 1
LILLEFDKPDAQKLVELENLLTINFSEEYGHCDEGKDEFPFSDALWLSAIMFAECKIKVGTRRIFIFTNQDNPNKESPELR